MERAKLIRVTTCLVVLLAMLLVGAWGWLHWDAQESPYGRQQVLRQVRQGDFLVVDRARPVNPLAELREFYLVPGPE